MKIVCSLLHSARLSFLIARRLFLDFQLERLSIPVQTVPGFSLTSAAAQHHLNHLCSLLPSISSFRQLEAAIYSLPITFEFELINDTDSPT